MRTKFALFALSALIVVACHTSKKSTTSTSTTKTPATESVATATTAEAPKPVVVKSRKAFDGIYEPGEEEVTAVQPQYPGATLEQLKEGYVLYAKSACVSCHSPISIYYYPTAKWPFILEDMSYKAKLTASQKDAVFKYVYAIVAADPNKK